MQFAKKCDCCKNGLTPGALKCRARSDEECSAMRPLDDTHDPALTSWVESANDAATDFPMQNLPYGRFRRAPAEDWRIGVAIGDQVLDLRRAGVIDSDNMNRLMRSSAEARKALRLTLSQALRRGSARQAQLQGALLAQSGVEMGLPCHIGDYTDFYTSIHHATAVGKEKLEDIQLQRKINDLCQEIGALVVAQKRNEAPDDAAAHIDAKVAEIAEIEKQQAANDLGDGQAAAS